MTSPLPPPEPGQPASPEPASLDALRAAAQAKALAVMARLTDLTLDLADALHANAKMQAQIANSLAEPLPPASMAAYDCIARCVRRTVLVLQHLAQPPRATRAAPDRTPDRALVRQRVLRAAEDAIQAGAADDGQAESLRGEVCERLEQLDRPEFARTWASLSAPALIADIVHDLGLPAPDGTHPGARPWARRTPQHAAAIAAWAAAPPGTPAESLPTLPPLRVQASAWAPPLHDPSPEELARMPDAELMRYLPPGTPWPGTPGAAEFFRDSG